LAAALESNHHGDGAAGVTPSIQKRVMSQNRGGKPRVKRRNNLRLGELRELLHFGFSLGTTEMTQATAIIRSFMIGAPYPQVNLAKSLTLRGEHSRS
jgi:hypothetical protein